MTNLLPSQLEGQADTFTNEGTRFNKAESGHWYSPNAVARMIEDARREEREACAKICDLHAIALDYRGNEYTRSREAELCAKLIRKRGEK